MNYKAEASWVITLLTIIVLTRILAQTATRDIKVKNPDWYSTFAPKFITKTITERVFTTVKTYQKAIVIAYVLG